MSDLTPITYVQQVALSILRMLNNDIASTKRAMDFIGSSSLNLELFRDSYTILLNQGDGSSAPENIGARVDAAIEQARNKLTVFQ